TSTSTPSTIRLFIFQLLRDNRRGLQALTDDIHVWLRCFNTAFALFLKDVQDKDSLSETHGVDGSVSAASVIFDYFQYACTAKSFQYFRRFVLFTTLGGVKRMAEEFTYINW